MHYLVPGHLLNILLGPSFLRSSTSLPFSTLVLLNLFNIHSSLVDSPLSFSSHLSLLLYLIFTPSLVDSPPSFSHRLSFLHNFHFSQDRFFTSLLFLSFLTYSPQSSYFHLYAAVPHLLNSILTSPQVDSSPSLSSHLSFVILNLHSSTDGLASPLSPHLSIQFFNFHFPPWKILLLPFSPSLPQS